jgi:hypothetical protein
MDRSADIRAMISGIRDITGLPGEVYLSDGTVVQGGPGVATVNDTLLGSAVAINGDEKILRFATTDVPGLRSGQTLTWNSKVWKVKHLQVMGGGALTKAFLQEVV